MSNSLVSVIVPIYNTEKHLKNCIESIINQTYTNLEIILVNDGSTDNSPIICDSYANIDNRIKVVNILNMGVSNARNQGLRSSTGKYIQFVDSDDFIDKDMIEILVNNIESQNADIVMCGIKRVSKLDFILDTAKHIGTFEIEDFIIKNIEMIGDNLFGSPCNKLYKYDIIKKHDIMFDPLIEYAEDLIFNYEYFRNIDRVTVNSNCLYNYNRDIEDTLSSKFRIDCYENLNYTYEQTIDFLDTFQLNQDNLYKINNKFANKYIGLVDYLLTTDNNLNKNEIRLLIIKHLKRYEKRKMLDGSKFHSIYFYIIWYLVKREYFSLLYLLSKLKDNIKNNDFIYKQYKKWIGYTK